MRDTKGRVLCAGKQHELISSPKGVVGDARHSHDFFDGSVFGLDVYEGGINGCVVGDVALDAVYTFRTAEPRCVVRSPLVPCSSWPIWCDMVYHQ